MNPDPAQDKAIYTVACGRSFRGVVAALALLTGCAGNPFLPATPVSGPAAASDAGLDVSAADAALLAALGDMPGHARKPLDGRILEAGTPYDAASGHECRFVRLLDASGRAPGADRLACRDGERHFFAADVFAVRPGAQH
ncbi:MAG: hypothetical protein PVI50_05020 [Gammaproteobacteria bacterium]|jgi:hypothetical protein